MAIIKQAKNIMVIVNKDYSVKAGMITEIADKINVESFKENLSLNSNKKVIQEGKDGGVKHHTYSPPEMKIEKSVCKLESNYAHEQLCSIADDLDECTFIVYVKKSFGNDIACSAYKNLYKNLSKRTIVPPEIIVTNNRVGKRMGKAGYSNKRKKILVWENFLEEAINNNDVRAELLAALVEEYGHHIDNLLRTTLAPNNNPDKDIIDEGAKFAYNLFYFDIFKETHLTYAKAQTKNYSGELIVDFSELTNALSSYVDVDEQYDADPNDEDIENFGAGFLSGQHGGIERAALSDLFKQPNELNRIYYGNWLRDYSQLITEASTRLTKQDMDLIKNDPKCSHLKDQMWPNPTRLSHDAMVRALEILAVKEFMIETRPEKERKKYVPNYEPVRKQFRSIYGELTKDILGIYRPEEHIDNPKGLKDCSMLSISFMYEYEKEVKKEVRLFSGETPEALKYDWLTTDGKLLMMKNYIQNSDTYLKQQLKLAVQYGRVKEGLRSLGAAFHIIEDFYSHSNFVELALRKMGWKITNTNDSGIKELVTDLKSVYPWIEGKEAPDITIDTIPLVTGKFLIDDTKASAVPKIGEKIFSTKKTEYEQRKPGDKDFTDCFILNLLEDLAAGQQTDGTQEDPVLMGLSASTWLKRYKDYLAFVDKKSEIINKTGKVGKIAGKMMHDSGVDLEVGSYDNRNRLSIEKQQDNLFIYNTPKDKDGLFKDAGKEYFEETVTFNLPNVPYKIEGWSESQDLRTIDKKILEERVLQAYKMIEKAFKEKDLDKIAQFSYNKIKDQAVSQYFDKDEVQEGWDELVSIAGAENLEFFPLEDYELVFYGDGRLVGLKSKKKDKGFRGASALLCKFKKEGSWTGAELDYLLHISKGKTEFEVY